MSRRKPPPKASRSAPRERLSPLGLVKAVFTHHVRLRREARGLTFVLEPQASPVAQAVLDAPLHRDQRALAMHAGLRTALDAAPGSRKVFRHLAAIEHHLWHRGALFIHDLPLSALERVREQLDGMARGAFGTALAPLRECIADAVSAQRRRELEQEMRLPPSSFFVDHKLQVSEATPSDFVEVAGDSVRPTETPAVWAS
jgi:hypothetical protein